MSGISPEPYWLLHQVNQLIESNFRAFQNLVGEYSVEGDPASIYNLTKSDPDPLLRNLIYFSSIVYDNCFKLKGGVV